MGKEVTAHEPSLLFITKLTDRAYAKNKRGDAHAKCSAVWSDTRILRSWFAALCMHAGFCHHDLDRGIDRYRRCGLAETILSLKKPSYI